MWWQCHGWNRCSTIRNYTNIPLCGTLPWCRSPAREDTLRSGGMLNIGSLALGRANMLLPLGTGAALVMLPAACFVDPEDAYVCIDQLSCDLCGHCILLPAAGARTDSAVLSNILPRLQCVRDDC